MADEGLAMLHMAFTVDTAVIAVRKTLRNCIFEGKIEYNSTNRVCLVAFVVGLMYDLNVVKGDGKEYS